MVDLMFEFSFVTTCYEIVILYWGNVFTKGTLNLVTDHSQYKASNPATKNLTDFYNDYHRFPSIKHPGWKEKKPMKQPK